MPRSPSRRASRRSTVARTGRCEKSAPGEVAAGEVDLLEAAAGEVGPASSEPSKRTRVQVREAEVRVVEPAVAERHVAQVGLRQLDRRRPAVDELHPLPDRLREVAARQIAADELDVDEPGVREVAARLAGVDHADPDRLAVLVELECRAKFSPVVAVRRSARRSLARHASADAAHPVTSSAMS